MSVVGTIESVYRKVKSAHVWVADREQYGKRDDWRSHWKEVAFGDDRFEDDCDGFACTCADGLVENGIPREQIRLIYCQTETGGAHLVCGVDLEEETLILDNRERWVWPAAHFRYRWIDGRRLTESVWRQIEGT